MSSFEIYKSNHYSGPCVGGKDIVLSVKRLNICKYQIRLGFLKSCSTTVFTVIASFEYFFLDNILDDKMGIKFYEVDESGNTVWETNVHEFSVTRGVALALK